VTQCSSDDGVTGDGSGDDPLRLWLARAGALAVDVLPGVAVIATMWLSV